MRGGARFDASGRYRWRLWRRFETAAPGDARLVCFIMLNPSTADAERNDPTIRRCIGFARDWGYDGIEVVNLFAFRATRPADLKRASAPIGDRNDAYIRRAVQRCEQTVLAWGAAGVLLGRGRLVLHRLEERPGVCCLGWTAGGQPRHPLYAPRTLRPQAISPSDASAS